MSCSLDPKEQGGLYGVRSRNYTVNSSDIVSGGLGCLVPSFESLKGGRGCPWVLGILDLSVEFIVVMASIL